MENYYEITAAIITFLTIGIIFRVKARKELEKEREEISVLFFIGLLIEETPGFKTVIVGTIMGLIVSMSVLLSLNWDPAIIIIECLLGVFRAILWLCIFGILSIPVTAVTKALVRPLTNFSIDLDD
jgi:hypothetical protein